MSLSGTQQEFSVCIAKLVIFADSINCGLTFGDAYRDPRVHGEFDKKESYSAAKSVHKLRLAVDFNVFYKGEYITDSGHDIYKVLGDYWKKQHELARWGGDFDDGNHFSFEMWGCK